jgi:hypothetical protein
LRQADASTTPPPAGAAETSFLRGRFSAWYFTAFNNNTPDNLLSYSLSFTIIIHYNDNPRAFILPRQARDKQRKILGI